MCQSLHRGDRAGRQGSGGHAWCGAIDCAQHGQSDRVFVLLDAFYPVPEGKKMGGIPFMPWTWRPAAQIHGEQTISLFDKKGEPLSPPDGYNFGGKLRTMQGIIVAPNAMSGHLTSVMTRSCTCPKVTRARRLRVHRWKAQ
jgi:hypothetical protein